MKKVISCFLAVVLSMNFCGSVLAASGEADQFLALTQEEQEAIINEEIKQVEEEVFSDVYRQLEEQGRTAHMADYVEALTPEIEGNVRERYAEFLGEGVLYAEPRTTGAFVYGGIISYTSSLGNSVVSTYLLPADALNKLQGTTTLYKILQGLVRRIPSFGTVFNGFLYVSIATNLVGLSNISKTGNYAHVMQVHDGAGYSTVILGWANHPNFTYTGTNVQIEAFSSH